MTEYTLDLLTRRETADLLVDFDHKVLQINWKGDVDFDDYQGVLMEALQLIKEKGVVNVVLNRLDLNELNVECRVWLKNDFLKIHARPYIPMLRKVATIEAKSALGRIYTNAITKTVSLVYPNLSFKSYSTEQAAYIWITEDDSMVRVTRPAEQERKVIRVEDVEWGETAKENSRGEGALSRFFEFIFGGKR